MALNDSALINKTYFKQMWDGEEIDEDILENLINAVSVAFELFCNRRLKERSYTYDEDDLTDEEGEEIEGIYYVPEYTIFDGIKGSIFYFPTYPVSLITSFLISGITITEVASTEYTLSDGYKLYKKVE